jgi:hypothetical protein
MMVISQSCTTFHHIINATGYLCHRLKEFENRVLRRTYGHKREELMGGWRRLHNEELHNLHASPNIVRVI